MPGKIIALMAIAPLKKINQGVSGVARGTMPTKKYVTMADRITAVIPEKVHRFMIRAIIGTVAKIRPKKKE